jgi:pseudaminic acid cytidylyltransferase
MSDAPFCVIPARGGSKRFPRKNVVPFRGTPLLAWTIEPALASGIFDEVHVSSDDPEILGVAERYGARTIRRPDELGGDRVGAIDVALHAYETAGAQRGAVYLLLPTSPLRRPETFRRAWERFVAGGADALLSVAHVDYPPQWTLTPRDGILEPLDPVGYDLPRQDLAPAYRHDGGHAIFRAESLVRHRTLLLPRTIPFEVPADEAVDVDEPADLEQAERVLERRPA